MTFHPQTAIAACIAALACAFVPSSISATDAEKMTGLPFHAGLTYQQQVVSPICGVNARINLYDVPSTATLAEYLVWYKSRLSAFHYVHKVWSRRAQEMFYSPDGSKNVAITGDAVGPGVYAVAFMTMPAKLTQQQMDAFSPDDPSCK